MASLADTLGALTEPVRPSKGGNPVPPPMKGWEPNSVVWEGNRGIGVSGASTVADPDHASLLAEWGFDPQRYRVEGPLQYRRWMAPDGQWLHYYKANIVPLEVSDDQVVLADIEELKKQLSKSRPRAAKKPPPTGEDVFVVAMSDWQIGKGYNGGTPATVERVENMFDSAVDRIRELRKAGRPIGKIALLATGDITENTCGFYPGQAWEIDLDRRDQEKVARRLVINGLKRLAPEAEFIEVATVGGNHGQNREDGKVRTGDADNSDVSIFEQVAETLDDRPEFDHVRFHIPNDEMSICLNLGGVNVGMVHGHQFTSGGTLPQAKALAWWKGQLMGFQAVSSAQILLSSHFHHYSCLTHGPRTHFQSPAMDGGSKWFTDSSGMDSPAGTLTFRIQSDAPGGLGWTDAQIL